LVASHDPRPGNEVAPSGAHKKYVDRDKNCDIAMIVAGYTKTHTRAGANWADWLPGTCQVGRLVRRPGGPPRQMLQERVERWKGPGPSAREGGSLDGLFAGATEFLVTPLLVGPVCQINQGRFEEPVYESDLRAWVWTVVRVVWVRASASRLNGRTGGRGCDRADCWASRAASSHSGPAAAASHIFSNLCGFVLR